METFKADEAKALLAQAEREFPEQKKSVEALIERERKSIASALAALPRDRWLEERPRVAKYRDWLDFMKRPAKDAERILAWRGTCTLEVYVHPYAELRGPLVAGRTPQELVTPTVLRGFEIADGDLELAHPAHAPRRVRLQDLGPGRKYVLEGDWKGSITLREEP